MGRGTDFRGYICAKIWETVHPVFTGANFPHWWIVFGNPRILTHGQWQQRSSTIINLTFNPYCTILQRKLDTTVKGRDICKSVRIYGENNRDSEANGTELNHFWHTWHQATIQSAQSSQERSGRREREARVSAIRNRGNELNLRKRKKRASNEEGLHQNCRIRV